LSIVARALCSMRLINTTTFEVTEFADDGRPPYAILSYAWGAAEVSFQDMKDLDTAKKKLGFDKIRSYCKQALSDGWAWAWIDTCCI